MNASVASCRELGRSDRRHDQCSATRVALFQSPRGVPQAASADGVGDSLRRGTEHPAAPGRADAGGAISPSDAVPIERRFRDRDTAGLRVAGQRGRQIGWRRVEAAGDSEGERGPFQALRRFEVRWPQQPSSFAEVAREMDASGEQVLCVVNLKKHAHTLIAALHGSEDHRALFHLSTNLCSAHRRQVLDRVRARLGEGAPCRLVSTQCIEAGVDLDFPIVYRALGPLEAIAQAAGRCNREGRLTMPDLGQVVVFDPVDESDNDVPPARERWRGRYPTFSYWQATEVTRTMLRETGALNLNDPAVFRDYYRRLFDLSRPGTQSPDLQRAIDEMDFPEIARLYRLIDQDVIQVIVPWSERIRDYEVLRHEADRGVDRHWMRRAQSSCRQRLSAEARPSCLGVAVARTLPSRRRVGRMVRARPSGSCRAPATAAVRRHGGTAAARRAAHPDRLRRPDAENHAHA